MPPIVDEIRQVQFRTARRGGYSPRDVDEFLDHLVAEVTALAAENERLVSENARLSGQIPGAPPGSNPVQFPG